MNTFATSNHTDLKLDVHALRSSLKLIYEYEFYTFPNKKVSAAKDCGKNYMKGRPPLVRHLLRDGLLSQTSFSGIVHYPYYSNEKRASRNFILRTKCILSSTLFTFLTHPFFSCLFVSRIGGWRGSRSENQ